MVDGEQAGFSSLPTAGCLLPTLQVAAPRKLRPGDLLGLGVADVAVVAGEEGFASGMIGARERLTVELPGVGQRLFDQRDQLAHAHQRLAGGGIDGQMIGGAEGRLQSLAQSPRQARLAEGLLDERLPLLGSECGNGL